MSIHTLLPRPRLTVKRADGGSDGADQPFETAFSNIAIAYISDRAPGLLDYMVGFQLVDRNDDNTKAMGVFGFKVGSNWLYAPVFFIDGDLKGHELLYVKNQDAFVPLRENWINYLLSKKPISLGEGVTRDTRQLGVRPPDMSTIGASPSKYAGWGFQSPIKYFKGKENVDRHGKPLPGHPDFEKELRKALVSKGVKFAWAPGEYEALKKEADALGAGLRPEAAAAFKGMAPWAKVACVDLARAAAARVDTTPLLPALLATGDVKVAHALKVTLDAYPKLADAFERFYPGDEIKEACTAAQARAVARSRAAARSARSPSRRAKKADHPNDRVRVYELGDGMKVAGPPAPLDAEEKAALFRDGVLIKDARTEDEVSHAYAVPVRVETTKALFSPDETGLYDVLTKGGDVEKCVVVLAPQGPSDGYRWSTVIRVEGDGASSRNWVNIHPSRVYCTHRYTNLEELAWFKDLPDADSLESSRNVVVLIGPRGQGTAPFRVVGTIGKDDGSTAYDVDFEDCCAQDRPIFVSSAPYPHSFHDHGVDDTYSRYRDGERVHLNMQEGTKLRSDRGDVYVPTGFKKLVCKVEAGFGYGDSDDDDDDEGEAPPVSLASAVDIDLRIRKTAGTLVRVKHDGVRVVIDGVPATKEAALLTLVRGFGLREKAARAALESARETTRRHNNAYEFFVKRAAPYEGSPYLQDGGPHAPGIPDPTYGSSSAIGQGFTTQFPQEELHPVPDMRADPSNQLAYQLQDTRPDPAAANTAAQAADTGQREVFDTAMIGSLLKTTRDDMLVDRHIGDLMKAIDRIGRILFLFYWHKDQFEERYGKDDLPELEDSLRNTLEVLGDLTLFLKLRAVEPSTSDTGQAVDLGRASDQ